MNDDEVKPGWPATWTRAALGTAVLASLEYGPLHGYGIAQAVDELGFGRPKGGSLYPLLTGLENDGAVIAQWEQGQSGPGKRNYALTPHGYTRLQEERRAWHALAESLGAPIPNTDNDSDPKGKKP
ncbi:PadR family transcriptional regulator [Glutamicibacter arilaitensis]|uniref:PadR family transcriptional regulator n=1 Tax=Glutamicibacter arilaitensis TaxID=256701 RepID=UPI00384A73E4